MTTFQAHAIAALDYAKSNGVVAIVTNDSAYSDAATPAQVTAQEVRGEYTQRANLLFTGNAAWNGVSSRAELPQASVDFTATFAGLSGDRVVILKNAVTTPPLLITGISSDVITVSGIPDLTEALNLGDIVVFSSTVDFPSPAPNNGNSYYARDITATTLKLSNTANGAAISLGDSWSGDLYLHIVGTAELWCYEEKTINLSPEQTGSLLVTLSSRGSGVS